MKDTADIQAMLNWLATCPLTNTLGDGDVAFSIEYLGADPVQFSLEATPAAPKLEQFFLGSRRARNYVLASRMSYTSEVVQQVAKLFLLGRVCSLGGTQVRSPGAAGTGTRKARGKGHLPFPGYLMSQDTDSCRFQIQLQLQYYQEGR